VDVLTDVVLLDLGDFYGDGANVDLVVGRLEEGVVQTHRYLLLLRLVPQGLCAEGRCLTTTVHRMMVPRFYRHSSTVMSSLSE